MWKGEALGYAFPASASIAAIMVTSKMDMGGLYVNLNDNVQSIASVSLGAQVLQG